MEVSVIIPVYNAEQWLQKCIASVLIHDCVKEIILINDGSTDSSLSIMSSLALKESRIILLSHPLGKNLGRSASRNLGIRHAGSNWIAFLDADDYFLDNRFDIILHSAKEGYYGMIKSETLVKREGANLGKDKTGIQNNIKPSDLYDFLTTQGDQYFSLISLTVKKEAVIAIGGFDENLPVGEDTDFIWRLSYCHSLVSLDHTNPIAIRTIHGKNSYSTTNSGRYLFYKKWLNQNDFPLSTEAKRRIYNAYVYYHPLHQKWSNGFVRILIKLHQYLIALR